MSVVLIGYRGSGKTTIGRKLADRLWWKFVDTDDLIVKQAGKSIREIFEQDGEEKFRDLEEQAVKQVAGLSDHVIALGGGAVLRAGNREVLKAGKHKIVYLRCEAVVLNQRIHSDPKTSATRPALSSVGGGLEEIQKLLAVREPIYRELKTGELEVTNLSVDEAVVYISRMI